MSSSSLYPSLSEGPSQNPIHARSTFDVDYSLPVPPTTTTTVATTSTTTTQEHPSSQGSNDGTLTTTTTTTTTTTASTSGIQSLGLVLKPNEPIPLSTYISISQVAISSALKVAMVSTSLSLGVARTIVSSLDKILNMAVRGVVGQNDPGSRGLNPAFVASLPFRAALLGINFSDILVQTILETVDGSVNLALNTVQDGLDLMDTLFGPDSTSQTGETFREVWAMLSREFTTDENGKATGYPALEGMRLLMAYIAIQFATSEQWETIRVRTQCRLVGECFESTDEENGSSNSWAAVGAWPGEWTKGPLALSNEELLEQQRLVELRDHREGRSASSSFYAGSPALSPLPSSSSRTPNPELTNLLAASYRFSRFCSAMYGSTFLEIMGAPERYPPGPPGTTSQGLGEPTNNNNTSFNETDNHFHHYTGTPLGSILYSSDTAATIHDGFYSPRYYLLDDVETKQIVLVLRGTKSLHDLMIDLTCDVSDLWLDHDSTPTTSTWSGQNTSGKSSNGQQQQRSKKKPFKVHGGFLKAARTIASADTIGIQEKIKAALEDRPGYSLLLIGHSLGAGIASILSMLWADPATGLTPELPRHTSARSSSAAPLTDLPSGLGGGVWRDRDEERRRKQYMPGYSPDSNAESFLPPGRRVRCYAYGTPKVMCPRMSKRAIKLVTSISYGDDVVGRLSLGSVRNIGHAMRALLAMRPPPPQSPPATPSPPSSPVLAMTTMNNGDVEVLHDSEDTLDQLLEEEGEGLERERREASQHSEGKKTKDKKPAYKSIGLEIVQKVIRWNLTKEEHLFEEFMDIRRAMHDEMRKHQEVDYDDEDIEMQDGSADSTVNYSRVSPVLVPAGKVLWVRPTTLEKELENEETKQHPIDSVLHQFEWDHPMDRDPSSLIPKPISQQLHQHLEEDASDSASIRSFKSTVRSGLHPTASASTSPLLSSSPTMASPPTSFSGHLAPPISSSPPSSSSPLSRPSTQRHPSSDSVYSTAASIATTTSPVSLQPGSQTTDRLLYRMYAAPNPEHVFDEMLFSRRMWSDHLPLTYEFILAGKHAIPVTVPHDETNGKK
ncbi:hypothetical protein BGZ59_000334 [Podila verticillata]|nr:hypothetical protein BGZ59_000334 [Podila verticillata]